MISSYSILTGIGVSGSIGTSTDLSTDSSSVSADEVVRGTHLSALHDEDGNIIYQDDGLTPFYVENEELNLLNSIIVGFGFSGSTGTHLSPLQDEDGNIIYQDDGITPFYVYNEELVSSSSTILTGSTSLIANSSIISVFEEITSVGEGVLVGQSSIITGTGSKVVSDCVLSYLNLVPSEHRYQPYFITTLEILLTPICEMITTITKFTNDFDLDLAIGVQLDAVGVRVNKDRFVAIPLDIYFSLGIAGLGIGEGLLKGPFDPVSGLTTLPDEPYRTVLKAVIAANSWDGTIDGAYTAYDTLFEGQPYFVLIQDYSDLSMAVALVGDSPDALTKALFANGELDLKPAGVQLRRLLPTIYPASTAGGTPLFGIGVQNDRIAGIGFGQLAKVISME